MKKLKYGVCPVETTVSIIGNKWKFLIIRNLLKGPQRFTELKKGINGISQKVLTENLRSLEEDGLIIRTMYPEIPPRVEYKLSEIGNGLKPVIKAMYKWGENFLKLK